ncbi:MAG: hypothetical protein QM477_00075 [Planctomycetota bacterium]
MGLFLPANSALPQTPEREWVIEDVIIPIPPDSISNALWGTAIPLGDHDGNQKMDFLIGGSIIWPVGHSPFTELTARQFEGLGSGTFDFPSFDQLNSAYRPAANFREPRVAFLGSPTGLRIALHDYNLNVVGIFDWATHSLVGHVIPPPPHPTWGAIGLWTGYHWAGDLNQDGFDDFFLNSYSTSGAAVLAMVDGKTMTVPWTHYEVGLNGDYQPTQNFELGPPKDLNGDGAGDLITTFESFNPITLQRKSVQLALSGVDGQVLWENRIVDSITVGSNVGGKDVNSDGVADALITMLGMTASGLVPANDLLRMSDGATGTAIWETNAHYMDGLFPPGLFTYRPHHFSFYSPVLGNPGVFDLCQVISVRNEIFGVDFYGIAHLDAMTGAFIRFENLPVDMEPWFPDSIIYGADPFFMPIGDIDRDGCVEFFHGAPIADFDRLNRPGNFPTPGLIYSQKTLFVPETIAPGASLQATISIPNGVNRACTLLLSTAFDNIGGLKLGEWRTHLAASPLLSFSLSSRPFTTILDSVGEGTIVILVPNNPALLGTTIYSRAIVEATSGPDWIWTVSTLGMTVIQ